MKKGAIDISTISNYTETEQSVKVVNKFPAEVHRTGQATVCVGGGGNDSRGCC
jgi:hypothetical protein